MRKRNFKRLIKSTTVLLIAITAVLTGGCTQTGTVSSQNALPVVVIGSDEYEPYNFSDKNGDPAGIDVEIATEAFSRIGYRAEFKNVICNDKDKYLESGKVDCLWGCFSMNGREEDYLWAGPYMNSRQAVAVRTDSDIYKLSDLNGKKIAVQSSSKPEEILSKKNNGMPTVSTLYCFVKTEYIFASIRKGYVDAIAGHEYMLREFTDQSGGKYRLLDESILLSKLGVAFDKNNSTEVPDKLRGVLKDMLKDGTIAEIAEKYGLDANTALGGITLE